tara:strand:+ start:250 stop:600 length:351 start_codon:yes stop_codon:yes gene_type:complete
MQRLSLPKEIDAVSENEKLQLRLYVTGQTPRSVRAITNINRLYESKLQKSFELVVIDVLENPQLAEDEKVVATPTLIKELPLPLRRIIGDFSDAKKVLLGLDLLHLNNENEIERLS